MKSSRRNFLFGPPDHGCCIHFAFLLLSCWALTHCEEKTKRWVNLRKRHTPASLQKTIYTMSTTRQYNMAVVWWRYTRAKAWRSSKIMGQKIVNMTPYC